MTDMDLVTDQAQRIRELERQHDVDLLFLAELQHEIDVLTSKSGVTHGENNNQDRG
jgi:hypothetical protein